MQRRWQLDSTAPYALQIAADARLSQTDYLDDQSWELSLGLADAPALSLQTQYGGRVGLASLVPMWWENNRTIYQAQSYARPPVVTAFAPGYLQVEARLTPDLGLTAEYWVMESHAVGARFTVENLAAREATLRLDLFGHVGSQSKELPLAILSLVDGSNALSMGRMPGLEPVVIMENAVAQLARGRKASPKIGSELTIPPGEQVSVRWVHAGMSRMNASLERAQFWLNQDWAAAFDRINAAAQAIPDIDTGNADYDALIAFSLMQLVQAFMRPTEHLPHASYVATRRPAYGFAQDANAYTRGWRGQIPQLAYLIAPVMATIDPTLAKSIIQNYLAVQSEDGWVDARPGLGGQRQDMLCPPLLAQIARQIAQFSSDPSFLKAVYPKLIAFFNRWSEKDLDVDGDVLPEWQDEHQTGYSAWPTFGAGQSWAQNIDIRQVESPDMAAYLLSEADSLQWIGQQLQDAGSHEIQERIATFQRYLGLLWYEDERRYAYHDRDTHAKSTGETLLEDGRADEEHLLAYSLNVPARVLVRISGGTSKVPRATLLLEGLDAEGNTLREEVDVKQFSWSYGQAVFTSSHVYAQVDRVRFQGLSRVYRVMVQTVNLMRLDINTVLPLWSSYVPEANVDGLVSLVMSEGHFLRPSGLTIVSASDPNFDASSARGGGGTWVYWTTLIGEGLLHYGHAAQAVELTKRLLNTQVAVLKEQKRFSEFYHSDEPIGLGEEGFLTGVAPLSLLMQLFGVIIPDSTHVWTGGAFAWGSPVTIRQHGVMVYRTIHETQITFPSGQVVKLGADAEFQEVVDSAPGDAATTEVGESPTPPEITPPESPDRVIIQVDHDND